jgi:biotin transport system substrate-specific component
MNIVTGRPENAGTLLTTWTAEAGMSAGLRAGAVLFVTVATAAAAQVSVPLGFTPVPLVLQDVMVLLGGAALGSRFGMTAQVLYLVAGICGLPVFAASPLLPQGPLRLLGPTGGYLISYPFAAFLTGYLAERGFDRRYWTSVLAMIAGLTVIFAFGVIWLALFARPAAAGFEAALRTGFYPFILGDIVKIFLGAAVLPGVWKIVGRQDARG